MTKLEKQLALGRARPLFAGKDDAAAPPKRGVAAVGPPIQTGDDGPKPGRDAPKLNFRMNEEEWDRVDKARGKFSRQEFIRGAVLAALKTIEVTEGT